MKTTPIVARHDSSPPLTHLPALLTPETVARMLSQTVETLANQRVARRGPPYLKIGRLIRYARDDVLAWLDGCRVETTSRSAG